jgi:hypothetical protein
VATVSGDVAQRDTGAGRDVVAACVAVAGCDVVAACEALAWRGLCRYGRNKKRDRDAAQGRDPPGMPFCRFKRA